MADIAKLFRSGGSQAVRLPKKYRFDCTEVEVSREGDAVILRPLPAAPWSRLRATLAEIDAAVTDMFPAGREQPEMQERPELDRLFE
jgi:antitoxin VapB